MLKSLYWKLTIAFVLIAALTAGAMALYIRNTSESRLIEFLIDQQISIMQKSLAEYYEQNGSWEGIEDVWLQIEMQAEPFENWPQPDAADNGFRARRGLFGLINDGGWVVISIDPTYPSGTYVPTQIEAQGTPIVVNDETVGTLITAHRVPVYRPEEARFLQRVNQALLLAIAGALVASLAFGGLLARTLTRSLHDLTLAVEGIAQGKLEQQVEVRSQDEVGRLASAFNRMSQEVARANQLRRQMTADIAHDLRTPLTVIAGYVESMRDGVLQPTTQRLSVIYDEIEHLQNLVGDLRMLSQADSGELSLNPQKVGPAHLLERAAGVFQHHATQQSVDLSVEADEDMPEIVVDEARMMQVMENIISNALRYTPANGRIILRAHPQDGQVLITVTDTGTGIAPEELPNIFNRFHRADKSRHAENGESGLGLAIVKALVEAQNGQVWAESAPEQGTQIHLSFPVI